MVSMPAPATGVAPFAPAAEAASPYTPGQPVAPGPGYGAAPSSTPQSQPGAAPPAYTPPPGESTAGRAKLGVDLRLVSSSQVAVGEFARFELIISNSGDGTARGVKIRDDFPPGLRHDKAQPGETSIVSTEVFDLPPNQSKTMYLTFEVVAEGQHCHTVTVTADGVDAVSKQECLSGITPSFTSFQVVGPVSRTVGEKAEFNVLIKNGNLPAKNVAVVLKFDPALELIPAADSRYERLQDGSIMLRIGDLAANEQRTFKDQPIEAQCKLDNRNACVHADLTVGGAFVLHAQECVDILPAGPGALGP
jgi:uncharacterized repeat protein (TIGR01451 family)